MCDTEQKAGGSSLLCVPCTLDEAASTDAVPCRQLVAGQVPQDQWLLEDAALKKLIEICAQDEATFLKVRVAASLPAEIAAPIVDQCSCGVLCRTLQKRLSSCHA